MSLPWYKYKLVWMIIAIPAASVIAGINMIYLAVNTDDGLVADDYYKEGRAINQNLKRDRTAAELGLGAELVIEDTGDMIRLSFNKGELPAYPENLTLHLRHATHAGHDQVINLVRAPEGQYVGFLQHAVREGVWHVMLATQDWRLVERIHWQNGLTIKLAPQ